jgi:hypothetical protein
MATIYVSPTGNDTTGDGSEGNPYATPGKGATVLADGDILYVKSGTYTLSTSTPGAGGPVVVASGIQARIEGYETTIGDLGAKPVIDAGAITSITVVTLNSAYADGQTCRNLTVDGQGNSSVVGFSATAGYCGTFALCRAIECKTGFSGTLRAESAYGCVAVSCGTGFLNIAAINCHATLCTGNGFDNSSRSGVLMAANSIASGAGGAGFKAGYGCNLIGCVAYDSTGIGFDLSTGAGADVCCNCLAISNGTYGFTGHASAESVLIGCYAYGNTSGANTGVFSLLDLTDLTADPFVDAANGDFNINDTAGGGAVLRALTVTL